MNKRIIYGLLVAMTLASSAASAATYSELAEQKAQRHFAVPAPYPANSGISIQPFAANHGQPYQIYSYQSAPGANYGPVYAPPSTYPYRPATGAYYAQPSVNAAQPMLPAGANGLPNPRQVRWSYGQVNASSDPFNAWGLSAPGMYVPWSTPMSSWSNAQGWDWWRNRAGDDGPPPPLW